MKIAIGCDPNAENEKQALMKFIENKGLGKVTDFGSTDPIYANVAIEVAENVAAIGVPVPNWLLERLIQIKDGNKKSMEEEK